MRSVFDSFNGFAWITENFGEEEVIFQMSKEHFKYYCVLNLKVGQLKSGIYNKNSKKQRYIFTLAIFYSMGNEICSVDIKQKQQQKSKISQDQPDYHKDQIHQEDQNLQLSVEQFDNPSRILNDHAFLKTNYTASNNKMFISAKPRYSLELKAQNLLQQLMRFKTPSLCNLQSIDFSIENKKASSNQTLTQNIQQKNIQKPEKPVVAASRQRRLSLEYALQNKSNLQSKQNITQTSSQIVLRQVSDFILTERNLFAPKKIEKTIFVKNRFQSILNQYNFISKVGEGSYGNVYKAYHKENNELRAVKVLKKSKLSKNQHEKTINQIQILKKLDHPNILKIFQIYFDTKSVSIVTEFCQGGSLYKVVKKNRLSLKTIKIVFRKLMTALAYLHSENIVHRDIKLDNIVLVSKYDENNEQSIDIRLIDFGLSKFTTVKRFKDKQKIGTCTHMAPQVIDGIYSSKSDIWSAGIVLCYLALGFNPFKGSTKEITFDKIQGEELRFQRGQWKKVNIELKDLIMKMLDKKIGHRISASEVLNHPWLQIEQKVGQTQCMLEKVTKKLYDYYRGNNLVTIVESYIAYTTTPQSQINQYSWIFSALDRDHDGSISKDQLQYAFEKSAIGFQKKEIQYVLQKVKEQHYGKLNFTEFVSILSDRQKMFAKKSLIEAFNYLDVDNSGYIDKKQLKEILNTTESQITCILKEIDSNKDLKISKDQFVKYLQDGNFY